MSMRSSVAAMSSRQVTNVTMPRASSTSSRTQPMIRVRAARGAQLRRRAPASVVVPAIVVPAVVRVVVLVIVFVIVRQGRRRDDIRRTGVDGRGGGRLRHRLLLRLRERAGDLRDPDGVRQRVALAGGRAQGR